MGYTKVENFNNQFLISSKNDEINEELNNIFDELIERIVNRYSIHPNLREMYIWYCKKDIENKWKMYSLCSLNPQPFDYYKVIIQRQINKLFDSDVNELKNNYKYETIIKPRIEKIKNIRNDNSKLISN